MSKLHRLLDRGDGIFASNQVIGETCVAVQHHYAVSRADARASLRDALRSGLVAPSSGQPVIAAVEATGGPGRFDRLIADGCSHEGLEALTPDRRMAKLADVRRLQGKTVRSRRPPAPVRSMDMLCSTLDG